MKESFGNSPKDNGHVILTEALRRPTPGESDSVSVIRDTIDSAYLFTSPYVLPQQRRKFEELNTAIHPERVKHVRRRLIADRPLNELKGLRRVLLTLAGAAGAATWMQSAGLAGAELFIAQSTDDAGAIYATAKTEKGGSKGFKQIAKENKVAIAAILGAGILDNYHNIIPHLLESPSWQLRLAGGGISFAAATAGSISGNLSNIARTYRGVTEQTGKKVSKLKALGEAWQLNLAHPFRKFLWIGTGLSAFLFGIASAKGILLGESYSAVLQTVLGQLETITGFGGLFLADKISSMKEQTSNLLTVKKAEKKR